MGQIKKKDTGFNKIKQNRNENANKFRTPCQKRENLLI